MARLNPVQSEIARQVNLMGAVPKQFVVDADANKLLMHYTPRGGNRAVNVAVTYLPGLDLYSVNVTKVTRDFNLVDTDHGEMDVEQLFNLLRDHKVVCGTPIGF